MFFPESVATRLPHTLQMPCSENVHTKFKNYPKEKPVSVLVLIQIRFWRETLVGTETLRVRSSVAFKILPNNFMFAPCVRIRDYIYSFKDLRIVG